MPRLAALFLSGLVLLALELACAGLEPPGPPPDPRMLRATIGPGRERLRFEVARDRAVLDAVAGNGLPDYVWAPSDSQLVLLFLAADRAIQLRGPGGARQPAQKLEPIPDDWLDLTAPDDQIEVRARRTQGAARALATPAGFCSDRAVPPPPAEECIRDPAAGALVASLQRRVLGAWRAPSVAQGGERVLVRFRVDAQGRLVEHCALGATSPTAAASALAAFDAVFPVTPLQDGASCLAGTPLVLRFEVATD